MAPKTWPLQNARERNRVWGALPGGCENETDKSPFANSINMRIPRALRELPVLERKTPIPRRRLPLCAEEAEEAVTPEKKLERHAKGAAACSGRAGADRSRFHAGQDADDAFFVPLFERQ